MKTIYKYPLRVEDCQGVKMPAFAEILTIQVQNEHPCLWALVDTDEENIETRYIEMFGTGNPIGEPTGDRKYISTFQLMGGQLVFHAFEDVF